MIDKISQTNRKYLLAGFMVGLLVGISATVLTYYDDRTEAQTYLRFHKKHLEGKITYLWGGSNLTYFKLDNKEIEYVMRPSRISDRQGTFYRLVEKGDSLFKPAFSDTVTIIKDGTEYKFVADDLTNY